MYYTIGELEYSVPILVSLKTSIEYEQIGIGIALFVWKLLSSEGRSKKT